MTPEKRRHAATATVGLTGVAASGALSHAALVDAYGERTRQPIKRPRFGAERRFIRHARGRGKYLAGAGLGLVSLPPAAVGTAGLLERKRRPVAKRERQDHRSFLREGLTGARQAVRERNEGVLERPPAKLVLGNYAAGAAIGAGAGGLVHHALERRRFPGTTRSGLARTAGVLAGAASLPVQRKITERVSHGRYTTTPTGVRRRKTKPVRPSAAADFHRTSSSGRVTKREDPGAHLTRGQRRALVTASGVPIPVVGDIMQAATASRLSPEKYKRRTPVQNFAGGQASGLAGNVAGAAGAVALANARPGFRRRAEAANERMDRISAATRRRARIPASSTPLAERALSHPRTPEKVRTGARAIARTRLARHIASNPKVAAVGALAGGAIAGQAGQQATYSRIMTRDDRYRRAQEKRRSSRRFAKMAQQRPLSQREQKQLAARKRRSAMMSYVTGTTGLASLGALGLSAAHPKLRKVSRVQTPLLTVGAGVGGVGAFNYANIQRKEAQARVGKAAGVPRISFRPRVPVMRRGFLRQTRTSTGMKVSTVRGGLQR